MESVLIGHGNAIVTRKDLDLFPLPQETRSYSPVSHYHFAERIARLGGDMLHGFELVGEEYTVTREGQRLFGVLEWQGGPDHDTNMAIGIRNSYDKSMTLGVVIGAKVLVCCNLALSGEIKVIKKHTRGIYDGLEDTILGALYRAQFRYSSLIEAKEIMKATEIETDRGYELLGLLSGREIVSPRQLVVAQEQWRAPRYEDFAPRNKWSLFNSVTESLKTCPPQSIMEKHVEAYNLLMEAA